MDSVISICEITSANFFTGSIYEFRKSSDFSFHVSVCVNVCVIEWCDIWAQALLVTVRLCNMNSINCCATIFLFVSRCLTIPDYYRRYFSMFRSVCVSERERILH